MELNSAKKQFKENRMIFGNPSIQPEKYNLYAGLENMVIGIEDIKKRLERIEELLIKIDKSK